MENRRWLIKLLTAIGFSVRGAEDGEEAIRIWRDWKPALDPDGCSHAGHGRPGSDPNHQGRSHGRETFIVTLTASALDEERRIAKESGADDFLPKPCMENELLETMRALLNVVYDYEEINGTEADLLGDAAWNPGSLGKLSRKLLEELRDATVSGNKKLLDKLILDVGDDWRRRSALPLYGTWPTSTNTMP